MMLTSLKRGINARLFCLVVHQSDRNCSVFLRMLSEKALEVTLEDRKTVNKERLITVRFLVDYFLKKYLLLIGKQNDHH